MARRGLRTRRRSYSLWPIAAAADQCDTCLSGRPLTLDFASEALMDTLTIGKSQIAPIRDVPDHTNPELRAARGLLWGILGGGALWCLIGLATWFGLH